MTAIQVPTSRMRRLGALGDPHMQRFMTKTHPRSGGHLVMQLHVDHGRFIGPRPIRTSLFGTLEVCPGFYRPPTLQHGCRVERTNLFRHDRRRGWWWRQRDMRTDANNVSNVSSSSLFVDGDDGSGRYCGRGSVAEASAPLCFRKGNTSWFFWHHFRHVEGWRLSHALLDRSCGASLSWLSLVCGPLSACCCCSS